MQLEVVVGTGMELVEVVAVDGTVAVGIAKENKGFQTMVM